MAAKTSNEFVTQVSAERDNLANAIKKEANGQPLNKEQDESKENISLTEHLETVEEVAKKFGTSIEVGMTEAGVETAREKYGMNALKAPKKKADVFGIFGSFGRVFLPSPMGCLHSLFRCLWYEA